MSTKKFGIVAGIALTLSVVVSPAFAACSLTTLSECDNNGLMALVLQLLAGSQTQTQTGTGTITGIPAGFTFTTNLKQTSTGNDVKYLQILLNSDPATAVGNAGSETTYFGAMTKAAVVKFQNKYASEVLTPYGLAAGTGFFGTASRAKANAMIAAGVGTGTGTGTGTVVTGGFTVAKASDNPSTTTFVQGQASADLAHYTFSNGTSTPVVVTSVTLDRIGISADATLPNVYLFDGATRITDAASVSAGKITFNATSGIFTIPANSAKTIIVKADILSTANGQTVGVSLSAVSSNGTLSTTLPIAGNLNNIASATLATAVLGTIQPVGTDIPTDPIAGVRIWESTINVGNRNVQFTKLALKQINSIDKADIGNFQLLVDGAVVSTVASLDANNYVTFTLDKTLVTGNRVVKVLADIKGGSSRIIQMSLRNKADIDLRDSEYGVNIAATGAVPGTSGTLKVNEGVFTITTDNSVLPVTVANNASTVLIGKWKFKASGEAVKVETLTAGFNYVDALGADNAAATLRNGKIMINGTQAGSTTTLVGTGTGYTVNYVFQPGVETTVELYADIFDNDGAGDGLEVNDTIAAKLITGVANGTKQISLGTIAVPTAGQATNSVASALTVAQGSATVVTTPNYGNQNTVLPRNAFKVGSWTVTGGTAEDINISNLNFVIAVVNEAAGGNSFTVADMSDMYLVYKVGTGTEVTTSVRPTPTSPADFSVSFTLPRTQTATIELYSSLLSGGVDVDDSMNATLTVTGTGAQSGQTASFTGAGTGQTIAYKAASLVVTKDASSPVASLVAGNNTVKTTSYKFEATNDTYSLVQLRFTISDPSAVTMVNLKEGSTILQSQPAAANVTFVGFATPITISTTPRIFDVELVLGGVGVGAGTSGANITTDFAGASSLARPSSTGTTAAIADAASGNVMYVYKAVPNISLTALPSTLLAQGTNTLSKFTVATNGTGTIGWKKITFTVSKSDAAGDNNIGAISNVTLWDSSTNTQISGRAVISTALAAAGVVSNGTIDFYPDAEEQITSRTYVLKADIGATVATGDSVVTSIANASNSFAGTGLKAFAHGTAAGTTTFAYADISAGGTVTQNDVRQTAVTKYTVAATTNNDVLVLGNPSQAYGVTTLSTVTIVTAGDDTITSITGNNGLTSCTANLMTTAGITTITCTGTGIKIIIPVTMTGGADADTSVITITADGALYAANTVVGATDSDLGIALTAGIPAAGSFIWSDLSAQSHSISTTDWTNDYLVRQLPTDTQNITK